MEAQDDEEQFQGAFKVIDNQQDAGNLPEAESLFNQELIKKRRSLSCSTSHTRELAFQEDTIESSFDHVDRPPKRSTPLSIVRNVSYPEKIAELFPSDSDSSWSAFSLSRPSSICSDHLNMSGTRWAQVTLESLDLATEQAKKNSSKIENIQKGTSRRAVRMKDVTSELRKRMTGLELSQRDMEDRLASKVDQLEQKVCRWIGKEEEYSDSLQGRRKALPKSMMIKCLPWVVPYSDLKRDSVQSISSPPLQLPWVQGLQATLYLLGIGKGHGSHLSIGFSWPKKGENPKVDESYLVNVTVKIIDQEDASEFSEKELLLVTCQEDRGSSAQSSNLNTSIPKLIPISTVEDTSLGYLSDGRLLINISIDFLV
ncbi:uncharacterized protein LOC105439170 [Strongylocentrotus purpuratus]|uniref:Uncharacterized protein n=1 Tax=Strongylocentrotus purpuratus TaxID=7668 RepID=A0A7M7HDM4_STRPU|nr:uncharacterized protein LOC105439170 [Strongylocentrotus purpuratus]|eukprot:XP_011666161.1 PREDICTED: uncharacterized protein LOC105439170 [Strongylocentrotus purpuratus]